MVNLQELLEKKDPLHIELRTVQSTMPQSAWVTYSAFANTGGGTLILGAERDPETGDLSISGVEYPERMIMDIKKLLEELRKVSANLLYEDRIYKLPWKGKEVVVMEVPRASRQDKPVYVGQDLFTGSYRRTATGNRKCSREEIMTMLREQEDKLEENRILWRCAMDCIDRETLHRYRAVFDTQKPGHPWGQVSEEEFLVRIGAAGRGEDHKLHPTEAGLLFFGERSFLVREFPRLFLDYRELLPSGSGWMRRITSKDGDWSGNLFDFYCRIIDSVINLAVRQADYIETGREEYLRRVVVDVDELISNGFIHADYHGEGGIVVDLGKDWISVANPGVFLVDPTEALAGGVRSTRNPALRRFFLLLHKESARFSNLFVMTQTARKFGFRDPQILENFEKNRVSVTVGVWQNPGKQREIQRQAKGEDPALQEGAGQENAPAGEPGEDALTELDTKILEAIRKDDRITVRELSALLYVSMSTVNRSLRHMKAMGALSRIGATRGRWMVKEQMVKEQKEGKQDQSV